MMKQPELGKKIVALRKQMGLTQEELVLKCNLNVRTLQRIESGEVNPRSHTIKSIFEALDYDEAAPKFKRYERVKHWLESNIKKYYQLIFTEENMSKLKTFFLRFFFANGLAYFAFGCYFIDRAYSYRQALNYHQDQMEILLSIVFPLAYAIVRSFEKPGTTSRKMKKFVNLLFQYFLSLGVVWLLIVLVLFAFEETMSVEAIQWTLTLPAFYALSTLFRKRPKPEELNIEEK